jgi:transglutaminase-like putative cysteine protease
VFEVTIKTKFVVPTHRTNLSGLGVWHALPTSRAWDGLDRTLGASAIGFEPTSGRIQHLGRNDSQNVFWQVRDGLKPGGALEFVSRFRVRSVDRTFAYQKSPAQWADFHHNIGELPPSYDVGLDRAVDEIKESRAPALAALEFCKWVTGHVSYDAAVSYSTADLPSILKEQKGHCGHQMALFEAMCTRAGIPTRTVVGLNLNTPEGVGDLHAIRPDFQNQHTWAQVYLPGSGWIEIDPGQGERAYFLPAQLIQNSTDFQNYVVWICENGNWKMAEWEYRSGRWNSRFSIENVRTFRPVDSGAK